MDALDDRKVTTNDTLIVFFLQDYRPEDEQPWQIVYEELMVELICHIDLRSATKRSSGIKIAQENT